MRRLAFAAVAMAWAWAAHASSLQISPVMVELPTGQQAAALTLLNPGKEAIFGQVRVFRWEQPSADDDALVPSDDLVASPPLIRIEPGGEQLVRLVRRDAADTAQERGYRVLVDEIPNPGATSGNGVTIRLRYSVPVFIEPPGTPGLPKLSWQLWRDGGEWRLRVSNGGTRRAQLAMVRVVTADGVAHTINEGLLGYVLAGRTRQWKIALERAGDLQGPLKIRANVNAQPAEAVLDLAPRP